MRFVPTFAHAVADYVLGAMLLFVPWIMRFPEGAATVVPMVVGLTILAVSVVTRYELGVFGLIPMPVHLMIDGLGGLWLLGSPWLFGFASQQWLFHTIVGILAIGLALTTRTAPAFSASNPAALRARDGASADRPGTPHP